MTLVEFQRARAERAAAEKSPRATCQACRNPAVLCYCEQISALESQIHFVILIHKGESRRSIATGRMAHLCLKNSTLLEGLDYSKNETLNALLESPENYPVLLYPGPQAVNLSPLSVGQRQALFPQGKRLLVLIIDGTWSHAKRIKRLSKNLQTLPQIAFKPTTPSAFRVRKQPRGECYSTIEAAQHLVELIEPGAPGCENILRPFHWMVARQIHFSGAPGTRRRRTV